MGSRCSVVRVVARLRRGSLSWFSCRCRLLLLRRTRPRRRPSACGHFAAGDVPRRSGAALQWSVRDLRVPPGYALPNGYQSTVTQYFTDVADDSFLSSNQFAVDTQYYDVTKGVKKFISYSVVYRGSNLDTHAFPAKGCPNYVLDSKAGTKSKVCLTDAQIQSEVKSVIAAQQSSDRVGQRVLRVHALRRGELQGRVPVAVTRRFDPIQQDGYCAYHSHVTAGAYAVLFAVPPYEDPTGVCWSGSRPTATPADSAVNTASHEQNESITDPLGTGWYDGAGHEVGDKCHMVFGPALSSTSTGKYNEKITATVTGSRRSGATERGACVQRNTFPQPSASFAFSPTSPVHGQKVTFSCSVSEPGKNTFTYRWTFPDGSVSSSRNPTHRFAKPVFVGLVTLIVFDARGDQARVVKGITVT